MSSLLGELEGLPLSALETAIGFGLGIAVGRGLDPLATTIEQEAFAADPSKALDPETAAELVAQRLEQLGWAETEAAASGINAGKLDLLHQLHMRAPAVGELVELLRRGKVTDADVRHALEKAQLEDRWFDLVADLRPAALEPGEIAKAVHRGIMAGEGLLIATPSDQPGKVPMVPPSGLSPVEQAAWAGLDHEQLRILVGNAGLPPGIVQGLQLLNRGAITEDDFSRLVAESNLRNEWTDAILHLRRYLLTPREYAEAELRGVLDTAAAKHGAGLHGLQEADYETLFETVGRPLNVHAVTTGLARGGDFGGTYDDVPEPYRDAIRRSNVRPEYARLAHANRYTYPSAFVLRSLVQGGELTPAEGEKVLLEIGWPPSLAAKVGKAWGGGATGTGRHVTASELGEEFEAGYVTEPEYRAALGTLGYAQAETDLLVHLGDARRVKRYREKVVDAIAAAFVAFRLSDTEATSELAAVNVLGDAAAQLIALWKLQRLDTVRTLTPAQVKKAHQHGLLTDAQAQQALEWLHYSAADAQLFLAE